MDKFVSLKEQLAYFDDNAERCFEHMLQEIADTRASIIMDARMRLEMGFGLYGDEMYHWPAGRSALERRQEAADYLNYYLADDRQTRAPDPFIEFGYDPVETALAGGPSD